MAEVKRWQLWNDYMVPVGWDHSGKARDQEPTGGPYVLATDYDAKVAECERLRAALNCNEYAIRLVP